MYAVLYNEDKEILLFGTRERKNIMTLLKDLDLLDRFLFDEAMEDPETYAAVLKIIFQANVSLLSQSEVEKQLQTAPYLKSVRLDVFAMDEKGTLYNTEMQKKLETRFAKEV